MAFQFRFDAVTHRYIAGDTGEELPHVTGMLQQTGWVDDRWFTEDSRERGTAVHQLTAAYDLGALDVASCKSRYRGYLLGHVDAMAKLQPEILKVEQPGVHPIFRYGCRPDRVWQVFGLKAIAEVKSGDYMKAHLVQTALQAILEAVDLDIPPEMIARFGVYLKANGKAKIEQFKDRRDFVEAYRVIKECCAA